MSLRKVEAYAYILISILVLVGAVLGFAIFFQESKQGPSQEVAEEEPAQEERSTTYTNEEYDFSVEVPVGWIVKEGMIGLAPAINIFPEGQEHSSMYDHFANRTHVSVYPQGIPTEGLFAQTRPIDVSIKADVSTQSRSYMLGNGDIFARYFLFNQSPEGWNESGFVWSRVRVSNQQELCQQGDEMVSVEQCDPFFGDEIVVQGEVDPSIDTQVQEILKTFQFVDGR